MQSLLSIITKVVFEKKHRPLLKLQKHARTIDMQSDESVDSVLYGCLLAEAPQKTGIDEPAVDDTTGEPISPRSSILYKGTQQRQKIPEVKLESRVEDFSLDPSVN